MGIDDDGLKRCSKCKKRKDPATDFGKHPRAKDGLQTACKDCYARYQRERRKNPVLRAEDRERINRAMAKRQAYYDELHNEARRQRRQDPAYREQEQAQNREIYRRVYRDDPGYQAANRERATQWRIDNPETYRRNRRASENTRRTRRITAEVTGPLPQGTYAAILASGPCVYCGNPAEEVDHITPLARGGHHAEYNLVPACKPCNVTKAAKLLPEWDITRVAHAVTCSEKVAAQLALQLAA